MVGKVRVDLTFDADNKAKTEADALDRSLKGVSKRSDSLNKSMQKTFSSIQRGAKVGAVAVAAVTAAIGVVAVKSVRAANVQEDAVKRLNVALKTSGSFSRAASEDLQKFAAAMEDATTFGDEAVLSQLALAKSFGATNEQAKLVVAASADMAAEMGIGLEQATRNVAKTLGGYAGELGETIPELKAFTQEQLRAGEGVTLLAERFKDAAKQAGETFGGSLTKLGNATGTFWEQLGFVITRSDDLKASVFTLTQQMKQLALFIQDNESALRDFVSIGVKIFIKGVQAMGFVVRLFNGTLSGIRLILNNVAQGVFNFQKTILNIASVVGIFNKSFDKFISKQFKEVAEMGEVWQKSTDKAVTSNNRMGKAIKDFTANLESEVDKRARILAKGNERELKNFKKNQNSLTAAQRDALKQRREHALKIRDETLKGIIDLNKKRSAEAATRRKGLADQKAAAISSTVAGAAQGLATGDFSTFATDAVKAFGNVFIPGLGEILGPIVQLLSGSEENVREMIRGFVDGAVVFIENVITNLPVLFAELLNAVPRFIEAFIDAIPSIIEGFIMNLPELINAIIWHLPKIILAVIRSLPKVIFALIKMLPRLVGSFIKELVSGAPSFIQELIKGAPRFITELVKGIGKAIGGAFGGIGKGFGKIPIIGGVVGGAVSAVRSIGKKFGFAEGGTVPKGFPGDTFPARLSSGEFVVNNSLSPKLEKFLDEAGQGGGDKISQILDIVSRPMVVNSSLEFNQQSFADIILTLNRTNTRIA